MSPVLVYLLAGLLVFSGHVIAGIAGFGNQIVALPLLAMLVGLDAGKCALVVLGTVMYGVLTIRWHEHINWRELGVITLLAGVGLVGGTYAFELLDPHAAKIALGGFVLVVGFQGLVKPALLKLVPDPVAKLLVLAGGVVHGAFTTGGPLLVIYAQRALPGKGEFRSTLSIMWILLNIALMTSWTITQSWSPETPVLCLVGLPFLLCGLAVGEHLHHRLNTPSFRAVVNVVLVLNGLLLIVTA